MQARKTEQLVARKHPLRCSTECLQQVELAIAQLHTLAARFSQPPHAHIQFPSGEAIYAPLVIARGQHLGRGFVAAQNRTHARQQLAWAERFSQVVVGAELEPHHAVGFVMTAAHDDDRDLGGFAQPFRMLHSIFAGQSQIENDHVDRVPGKHLLHVGPGRDRRHAQLVFAQIVGDQLAHIGVIVDRQHMGRRDGCSRHRVRHRVPGASSVNRIGRLAGDREVSPRPGPCYGCNHACH